MRSSKSQQLRRRVGACVAALLLAGVACKERPAPATAEKASPKTAAPITFAVLSGLGGSVARCGGEELGGLDRVAGKIDALRREGPLELLVVGNTFFGRENAAPGDEQLELKRAELIAEVLAELQPVAVVPGPFDLGIGRETITGAKRANKLPIFERGTGAGSRTRPDHTVRTFDGLHVGFVGIPGTAVGESAAYAAAATAVRVTAAEFVIGLVPDEELNAAKVIADSSALNVGLGGGTPNLGSIMMADGTLFAESADRGRALGLLSLHRIPIADGEREDWVFDDGGESIREGLNIRIERFKAELARTAPGPARDARAARLRELEGELATVGERRPDRSSVRWRSVEIDDAVAPAAKVTERIEALRKALNTDPSVKTGDPLCGSDS